MHDVSGVSVDILEKNAGGRGRGVQVKRKEDWSADGGIKYKQKSIQGEEGMKKGANKQSPVQQGEGPKKRERRANQRLLCKSEESTGGGKKGNLGTTANSGKTDILGERGENNFGTLIKDTVVENKDWGEGKEDGVSQSQKAASPE